MSGVLDPIEYFYEILPMHYFGSFLKENGASIKDFFRALSVGRELLGIIYRNNLKHINLTINMIAQIMGVFNLLTFHKIIYLYGKHLLLVVSSKIFRQALHEHIRLQIKLLCSSK